MLQLDSFNIDSLNYTFNNLEWELTILSGTSSDYRLEIYRSETPGLSGQFTDYTLVASGIPLTQHQYNDSYLAGLQHFTRTWYYKLKAINITTSETFILSQFPSFAQPNNVDYARREIIRRKTISLNKFSGRKMYLLKRRSWGAHCSKCWDEALFTATDGSCTECYGTGWSGGYFTPVPFYGMLNPSPRYNEIMMFGVWHPSDTLLTMLNYPKVVPGDVIIDDAGYRWIAHQIRTLEKLGQVIEHLVQLNLIALDDIVYTVGIDFSKLPEEYVKII